MLLYWVSVYVVVDLETTKGLLERWEVIKLPQIGSLVVVKVMRDIGIFSSFVNQREEIATIYYQEFKQAIDESLVNKARFFKM